MSDTRKFPSGLAAADALDELLSKDDFEPTVEVDTAALDATLEALTEARELVRRLTALKTLLAAGSTDDEARIGLGVDVRVSIETLDAITVGTVA
jgi:hypothetical protein